MSNQLIVGIAGGSGSGKTTFLKKLKESLSDKDICYISTDNYYFPREEQSKDANGVCNFDLPCSIDIRSLINDLKTLTSGNKVVKQEYTFNNKLAESRQVELHPAPIYIVEGLFVYYYEELAPFFDLKLFIEAKEAIKLIRRISRDQVERNYPLDDVLYRYEHHVLPAYEKYIEVFKSDADMVINNNQNFDAALAVVTSYLKGY